MTEALPTVSSDFDDTLRPETSQAPSAAQIPVIEAPESSILAVDQLDGPSLASTLKLPESPGQFLSPIPSNKPQLIFALSDLLDGPGGVETLGADIASADINVAPDGSFIETSSGPAARELKRRYDQLVGVGPSVRSPYAITAFVSQHGKQMYRIGLREEHSAPAASAAEVEERISQSKTSSEASHSPRTKRRSRLSMHFLPPVFAKNSVLPPTRPPTASSSASSTVPKKLRKTRSIPDMSSNEPVITTTPTFAVTGRGHSQSVTAMDNPRSSLSFKPYPAARQVDAFAELMDWFTPASTASNFSTSSFFNNPNVPESHRPRVATQQPFGPNVTFNAPSHAEQPPIERLPATRLLREMQSFESGLTARQDDSREALPANDSPVPSDTSDTIRELSRPASAIRLSMLSTSAVPDEISTEEQSIPEPSEQQEGEGIVPSADALRLSSHYSTEVFNVLQTYRGLPMFENLVPETQSTTIKLSLEADQTAAPRDDPRFVLWGEMHLDPVSEDHHSNSRDSLTDASASNPSSSNMSVSKRRSSRVSKFKSPEVSTTKLPAPGSRILLAATIERWIAQLTSDLNYDELLNFFLTYRTYVSSVDLCHLLICRFHWALQQPTSKQDEIVRRIVRVRTFVAIRYWLLTFFTVDFIPNRELRLLIADWLNTLIHDPILKKHVDAIGIVRRLIKVAKECRGAHTRTNEKPKSVFQPNDSQSEGPTVDHVLGKSFAQAIRKPQDDDSDLDLDFLPDETKIEDDDMEPLTDPANAHLSAAHAAGSRALSTHRPSSLPLSSLNILHRTDHAPGPSADVDAPFIPNTGPVHLPTRQSTLSRAFVKTISRLGRWKRVLHTRHSTAVSSTSLAACGVGASAFDIEINAARDLLTVNGGVEQYLKLLEPPVQRTIQPAHAVPQLLPSVLSPAPPALSLVPILPTTPPPTPANGNAFSPQSPPSPTVSLSIPGPDDVTTSARPESPPLPPLPSFDEAPAPAVEAFSEANDVPVGPVVSLDEVSDAPEGPVAGPSTFSPRSSIDELDLLSPPDRPESFRSSSTDSFGVPLTSDGPVPPTFPGQHNPWQFDVVSVDDIDFSDTSSLRGGEEEDPPHPPGLRRPPRKLPFRRDFEFVRRSEVSSMGIVSHESMRDSITSSTHSESSPSSSGPPPPIHKWQMKSLQQTFESMSDEEDNGDVEAALRRLEGQINPKIEQEKADKVDGWVRTLQERMANGDYDYESSLFSEDDVEGFIDEVDLHSTDDTEPDSPPEMVIPTATEEDADNESEDAEGLPRTPVPLQTIHQLPSPSGLNPSPPRTEISKQPAVEDVVPLEILQSRMPPPEMPSAPVRPSIETVLSSKFVSSEVPRAHRSFVTLYPAEQLAEHFAMIDRELFMGIKFEELVTEEWMECEEINVLDWSQYLKDRARWKAESQFPDKTTALAAVRARFNLMVAFVIAEVVLTPPSERPNVINRLIRIAWKSYNLSNFNALTAIITALQNEWSRVFRDLKQFTSPNEDFKFIRQVVDSIVDAKPLEGRHSHTPSVVSGVDSQNGKGKANSESRPIMPSACIPFIGIYLSQLHRLNKLPALCHRIDPVTANFDPPAHPEVFSSLTPLPHSMRLEPLINVHKQRRIANVIKSLVAGQHLASRFHFDVDKKLFQKCLRLRGLDAALLQRALAVYE
ncbi:hypothetical protein CPB84DRAFT_1778876 [Gymnopilus junonius]|uniref:Ras GEF n=1 Tax=Gymnopilus junonius TaxID=109634 RepID=A0A9P5NQC6_GYMJU|nr:hypothetical protein CPB84DRAFT_1778876 [Gymnopilus junonius]